MAGSRVIFDQLLKEAIGLLIRYVLAQGRSVDDGNSVTLSMDGIVDVRASGTVEYGDWKITLERTRKP